MGSVCGWPASRASRIRRRRTGDRLGASGLAIPGEGMTTRGGVLDYRRRVVLADDAAGISLCGLGHRPGFGQVLVGHAAKLGDVAPDISAVRVEAALLARWVIDAAIRWLGVDPDRCDPLPVPVVARLVAVD